MIKRYELFQEAKGAAKPGRLIACDWSGYYVLPAAFRDSRHAASYGHQVVDAEAGLSKKPETLRAV